jgi:hypothetical protein
MNNKDSYILHSGLENYLNRVNSDKFTLLTYKLFQDHKEYFSQDKLLHRYNKLIASTEISDFRIKSKLSRLSPLYTLYFFLNLNKRFLSIYKKEDKEKNFLFKIGFYTDGDNKANDEMINELLDSKSPDEFIFSKNDDMYKSVKEILVLWERKNIPIEKYKYQDYFDMMKKIIENFYEIYIHNTQLDDERWEYLFQNIKTPADLYDRMVLGKINSFSLSEYHINNIQEQAEDLKHYLSTLQRDAENLPD